MPLEFANSRPSFAKTCGLSAFLGFLLLLGVQYEKASSSISTSYSTSRLRPRQASQGHIILPTTYNFTIRGEGVAAVFTELLFGEDNQPLVLEVTNTYQTWVPLLPQSRSQFCSQAVNTKGCQLAGTSGYYSPPRGTSRNQSFEYETVYANLAANVTLSYPRAEGFYVEDLVTAGGVSVNLQFGVADFWNATPVLGLGLVNTDADRGRPSYLDALTQQGVIASPYCSFYQFTDPTAPGSVTLGALDRDKFIGKFKVFNDPRLGITMAPSTRVLAETESAVIENVRVGKEALVAPGVPVFYLPQEVLDELLPNYPITNDPKFDFQATGFYVIPCNPDINPDQSIEFTFEDFTVKIPLVHLVIPVPVPELQNQCTLSILPISSQPILYNFSYILGDPFLRSVYLVANPQENVTALALLNPNITTEDIVELGGSFGQSLELIEGNNVTTPNTPSDSKSGTPVGAIAGGVVGGIAALAAAASLFFYLRRRKRLPPPQPPEAQYGPSELESKQADSNSPFFKDATNSIPPHAELASPPSRHVNPAFELPSNSHEPARPTYELPVPNAKN